MNERVSTAVIRNYECYRDVLPQLEEKIAHRSDRAMLAVYPVRLAMPRALAGKRRADPRWRPRRAKESIVDPFKTPRIRATGLCW